MLSPNFPSVADHEAGTASGAFNTSRQFGGALAVAVFGAFLAQPGNLSDGTRMSFALAALVTLVAAAAGGLLHPAARPAKQVSASALEGVTS